MPGLSATVGEQIEALRRAAGDEAVALIRREPDPMIQGIVAGWATRFDASRALDLGFMADASFDDDHRARTWPTNSAAGSGSRLTDKGLLQTGRRGVACRIPDNPGSVREGRRCLEAAQCRRRRYGVWPRAGWCAGRPAPAQDTEAAVQGDAPAAIETGPPR